MAPAAKPAASSQPLPEIRAAWHGDPARGPTEATAQPLDPTAEELARALFRGIRTDGSACIITVPLAANGTPDFKLPGSGPIHPPDLAPTEGVPQSWPDWLRDALAGGSSVLPMEFARALPRLETGLVHPPPTVHLVHRTDIARTSYKLLVWPKPPGSGEQLIAWSTGNLPAPVVEGAAAVSNWPEIKPFGADITPTSIQLTIRNGVNVTCLH